ncbi:MAG: GNAT family N-acetyltransferase, partial [Blastomonas sp.]|nr:GNAT family N-acetyltransferase [Blastomonas sp.]
MDEDGALATERLILRPPVAEDLPWVLAEMNTEPVLRHLGGVRPAEAAAENFAGDITAFAEGTHMRWTVWLRDSSVRVGRVGLFTVYAPLAPAAMKGQREIGWTFAQAHWGRGYATEAARAVIGHAFTALRLPVLYAQTSDSNAAST